MQGDNLGGRVGPASDKLVGGGGGASAGTVTILAITIDFVLLQIAPLLFPSFMVPPVKVARFLPTLACVPTLCSLITPIHAHRAALTPHSFSTTFSQLPAC